MGIVRTSILGRPGRLSAHCSSSVNAAHTLTCEEPSSPTTRRGVVIDQLDGPACLDSPSSVRHLVSVSESHPFFPWESAWIHGKRLLQCHPSDKRGSRPTSSTTSSTANAGIPGAGSNRISRPSALSVLFETSAASQKTMRSVRSFDSRPVDGEDDELAAVAVLHQVGGSVRTIARHFWHLADGEAEGIVTGAMWEQIRAYDWHGRTSPPRRRSPPRDEEVGALRPAPRRLAVADAGSHPHQPSVMAVRGCHGAAGRRHRSAISGLEISSRSC